MGLTKVERAKRQMDKAIEAAWYAQASGVQVSVLDIPKIFKEVAEAVNSGTTLFDAVEAAKAKYRHN